MKAKASTGMLIVVSGMLLTGCIGPIISHNTTLYRDVERTRVEFESDATARLFYETLSKNPQEHKHAESKTRVWIPVVYSQSRTVIPGRNTEFNEAVAACDVNGDGEITEMEVRVFANQW